MNIDIRFSEADNASDQLMIEVRDKVQEIIDLVHQHDIKVKATVDRVKAWS